MVFLAETFVTPQDLQEQQSNATSTTSLEPGTLSVHTVGLVHSGTNCGGSTQAPLPRKTSKREVGLRKPLPNLNVHKVNPNKNERDSASLAFLLSHNPQRPSHAKHTHFSLTRFLSHEVSGKPYSPVAIYYLHKQVL